LDVASGQFPSRARESRYARVPDAHEEATMHRSHYVCALALFAVATAHAGAYRVAHEVKIAGDTGWDDLTVDSKNHRLYVSHGTRVEVIDTRSLTLVGVVADTPGVHAIAIASDLGRGYVSAGASSSIVIFDLKTLARLGEITTGANPDAIQYEPGTQRVFSFNGRGRDVTVVDAVKNEVMATIPLDAKPEFAANDNAGHIFVNLEDRNSIAQIDVKTLAVISTWPLPGCEEPSGLAIDRKHHRLFSVCGNEVMSIVDSLDGHAVAQVPIGKGVDGAGFDEKAQLAFASAGEGKLTIVKEQGPDKFEVLTNLPTKTGARTMTLDAATHRVFSPTAQRGPAPAATAAQPRPRGPVIEGTFEILVIEQ
jgi:DNA-binding beta-propeller fold protein YncE